MPTVSTAIPTSTPTWPRNRSRSPRPSSRSRSPPTNSSRMRWGPASFAAARRSAVITVSWPRRAILQVRSDRRDFRPYGLYGGGPGKPSMNYLNPEGENRPLPSKLTMTIRRGDTFRHEVAGAGGWGDPLERDPAMVLRDVRNELVSLSRGARGLRRGVGREAARSRRSGDAGCCAKACVARATGRALPRSAGSRSASRWPRNRG